METIEDSQDEDVSEELSAGDSEEIISEDTCTSDEEGLEEYEDEKEEDNRDAEGYTSEEEMFSDIDEIDVGDDESILHFVEASFHATQYITTTTVIQGIEKHVTSANCFKNLGQSKHICGGAFLPKDALNVAMHYADTSLPLEISQYLAVLLVCPLYSLVQTVQCMLHLSVT